MESNSGHRETNRTDHRNAEGIANPGTIAGIAATSDGPINAGVSSGVTSITIVNPDGSISATASFPRPAPCETLPTRKTDEVIVGWRAWRVQTDNGILGRTPDFQGILPSFRILGGPRLVSTFMRSVWEPGKPMVGSIEPQLHHLMYPRSGVHSWETREQCLEYCHPAYVFGRVSLWGAVVRHESGFRAQYGYPMELFVPRLIASGVTPNELRGIYGVEAQWFE